MSDIPGHFDDEAVCRCTARLVDGDRAAFELLFRQRCSLVEAEAFRCLGRRLDLAPDAAQEAWLRVARSPRRCNRAASMDAWLRRIVRSSAIDLLRSDLARRSRELRVSRERHEAVEYSKDFELLEQIRRDLSVVEGLAAEDRSLLELVARTDATVAMVAGWLGIGPAAVDSRLRRAAERARAMRVSP